MVVRLARTAVLRVPRTISSATSTTTFRPLSRPLSLTFRALSASDPFDQSSEPSTRDIQPPSQGQSAPSTRAPTSRRPVSRLATDHDSETAPPSNFDDGAFTFNPDSSRPNDPTPDPDFGSSWSAPPPRAAGGPSTLLDVAAMMDFSKPSSAPDSSADTDNMGDFLSHSSKGTNAALSSALSASSAPPPPALPPLRIPVEAYPKLSSRVGRSVPVDERRGVDFNKAVRRLEMLVRREKVMASLRQQRFHERPGMERKRLRRERWRRRFKEGFQATVTRVIKLRNQGW